MRAVTADRQRGVTTVMFALLFSCLLAAAGLGIDTSKVSYHRSRLQHSADAAALGVAFDCVTNKPCNVPTATTTSNYFAVKNSEGGTASIPGGLTGKAAGKVTVQIDKTISTPFFSLLGVGSKDTGARATAIWGSAAEGTVLPFIVSLCQYEQTDIGETNFLATDRNDLASTNTLKNKPQTALEPYLQGCDVPSDVSNPGLPTSLRMYNGGLWISSTTSNNVCDGKIELSLFDVPPDARAANEGCTKKFSDDLAADEDGIILLAIYAPTVNYNYGGVRVSGKDDNMGSPVKFGLQIVGFAPFQVTGWCLGQPAACGGSYSNASNLGIDGHFISTAEKIPDTEYDPDAPSFGATAVELTE